MTPLQRDLLRFIENYLVDHGGVAPSYEEMRAALGLVSKASVARLVHALKEQGRIHFIPNRARSIAIAGGGDLARIVVDEAGHASVTIRDELTAAQVQAVRNALVRAEGMLCL